MTRIVSKIATPEATEAAEAFFAEWRRSLSAADHVPAALAEAFDRFAIVRVKEEKPQYFWDYSDGFVHGYEKARREAADLRERADALALQADEWEGKYAIVSDMNARLMKRLEVVDGVSWESGDGIACRDETIRLQDQRINRFLAEIATLRAELAAAREALDAANYENGSLKAIVQGWHYLAVGPDEMGDYYTHKQLVKASEPYASPALRKIKENGHDVASPIHGEGG